MSGVEDWIRHTDAVDTALKQTVQDESQDTHSEGRLGGSMG